MFDGSTKCKAFEEAFDFCAKGLQFSFWDGFASLTTRRSGDPFALASNSPPPLNIPQPQICSLLVGADGETKIALQ